MNLAYIRVSSKEQNEERQRVAISEKYKIDKWFVDKMSGKNMERPQFQQMLEFCREGDTIYIHDLSRLNRNTKDLLSTVELLEKKKVHLVSNKESIDTSTPVGRFFITVLGAIYELERENIRERQEEGIALAKSKGKYTGGKEKKYDVELFERLIKIYNERGAYKGRKLTKGIMAEELNVTRATLDRIIKRTEETNNVTEEND